MSLFAAAEPSRAVRRAAAPLLLATGTALAAFATALVVLLTPGWANDERLAHALNHAFAALPFAAEQAAVLDGRLLETALAVSLVVLWSAGRVRRFDANRLRRRALLVCVASVVTAALCAIVQEALHRTPPSLMLPLERFSHPQSWAALDAAARSAGSFPSVATALTAVVVIVAFSIERRFGFAYLILGVYVSFEDVALGAHWPSDAVGGAFVGTLVGVAALLIAPALRPVLDRVAAGFSRRPSAAYTLAFLFLAEFAGGFARIGALARTVIHAVAVK